jgi:hypothetical protein
MFPRAPGYGRINMLCGSMDYELADRDGKYYLVNRRDIADFTRYILKNISLPDTFTMRKEVDALW